MTMSKLACMTILSPNTSGRRGCAPYKITPHHMAGDLTVESCGGIFANPARQASSNYGIGSDGRIACYLPEEYHPWTSANWANDEVAITFEIADFDTREWSPSKAAWDATVELCVDICQRYGIPELVYTGDPSGNLTEHMMFSSTSCPGPWWHAHMQQLADEVNAILNGQSKEDDEMQALYRPDGKSCMVWYDGHSLHQLDNPDEMKAVQQFYRQCTGKDIPTFEFGSADAPWAHRFEDAVMHGFEQGHM